MLLFKKQNDLQTYLANHRQNHNSIGFVPTMGALHDGHSSLLKRSLQENDCTVCSIFVNPTQFNDAADLDKYPRTPEKDIEMLCAVGCDALFMPSVEEMYPFGKENPVGLDFEGLDKRMEGAHRPGHFEGVAQVVKRLLDIVAPDHLYMGQKDFQQFAIVQFLIEKLRLPSYIIMCETLRETDGLAMSSRNVRLSPEGRALAPLIFQALCEAKEKLHTTAHPRLIENEAMQRLAAAGMAPEYFEIVDGKTLLPIAVFDENKMVVACTAAKVGEVRLIDNLILNAGNW